MFASFVEKYKSIEVKNTPPSSSTIIVCANGSCQPITLLPALVEVSSVCLVSVTVFCTPLNSLVETIVSLTVFNNPLATYSAFAAVSTAAASCELVEDEVNLNVLSPVLHLGLLFTFGSGIAKVPDTLPFASEIKLPPAAPPVGVTYWVISMLSKNG